MGEVFREYSEKGHTELPTLTIIQGGGTVKREDSDRNLMYDEANLSNYKMVRKDDYIVHLRSFEGGLEISSLDGIISPAYHTFHSDEADSRFYYPYFRSFEFIKHKLVPHVYGIRDGRSIDIDGMKSIEIPYTSLSEQREIGDYLELLDHIITLHQCKCHVLPKRLHNDWEQRKLGELYIERNERGDNSLQILSVSIHSGVSDKELNADGLGKKVYRSKDKSTYKHVYAGDLIFNMMRAWQGAIGVARNEGMISPAYISAIPNEKVYPLFMNYLLRRRDVINQINNLSYGVTDFRKRLYWDSFIRVTCQFPSVAEQKKITEFFDGLDHIITLHHRKYTSTLKSS